MSTSKKCSTNAETCPLIPKKTYKKVEKLLTDSLQLAGLLRTDNKGGYWGALKAVFPAGTSQTCLKCEQLWNKDFKEEIITFSKNRDYQNIDFTDKTLNFDKKIYLNETYTVFNRERENITRKKTWRICKI